MHKNIPEGYTQIVNAIECGLKGETEKMKWFIEQYIKRYPKGEYIKPFKYFITGEPPAYLDKSILSISSNDQDYDRH